MPNTIREISLEQESIGVTGGTTELATKFRIVVTILFFGIVIFLIVPWIVGTWYIFNHVLF